MSETRSDYNAKIVGEFRANEGRVGGMWEEIPLTERVAIRGNNSHRRAVAMPTRRLADMPAETRRQDSSRATR